MKFVFLTTIIVMAFLGSHAHATPRIEAFTSDGCSKWLDGPVFVPDLWKSCCFQHDIYYWMGGTAEEKSQADNFLRRCVNGKDAGMGWVMEFGVKIGGSPKLYTAFRWGYGWPEKRPYGELSREEKKVVADELARTCFAGEDFKIVRKVIREKGLNRFSKALLY